MKIKLILSGAILLVFVGIVALLILYKNNPAVSQTLPLLTQILPTKDKAIPPESIPGGKYEPIIEGSQKARSELTEGYFLEYNQQDQQLSLKGKRETLTFSVPITSQITCWPEKSKTTDGKTIDLKTMWIDWREASTLYFPGEYLSTLKDQYPMMNDKTKLIIYQKDNTLPDVDQIVVISCVK